MTQLFSPKHSVPAARSLTSHSRLSEHTQAAPSPVQADPQAISPRPPSARQVKVRRYHLRPAHIWEDEWDYELDHPGEDLHIPILPHTPEHSSEKSPKNTSGRKPNRASRGQDVALFKSPEPPQNIPGSGRPLSESPLKRILTDINARAMTPRQVQNLSLDLYVNGILTWDEHVELAFQAELHPDFNRTIGALTGEQARPDRARDYIKEWEKRLDFERRFAPAKSRAKDRALHILSVLRRIEGPANDLT